MISYCSTCMNRGEQLRRVLPRNLEILAKFEGRIELCLVNFIKDSEGEAIHQWISSLEAPRNFHYFASRNLHSWHASVAKNTAHRVAHGDYLINLDCDNFLDPTAIQALLNLELDDLHKTVFSGFTGNYKKKWKRRKVNKVWRAITFNMKRLQPQYLSLRSVRDRNGLDSNGTYGNLGLAKDAFEAIGGYDESLPAMGGQDRNLLLRALNYDRDFQMLHVPQTMLPVDNDKLDSLRNTDVPKADWKSLSNHAKATTENNLRQDKLVANSGKEIGVQCEQVLLS
jgi:hypothetical protein